MRGAIIAGGDATRYGGQPKGLLQVGGVRILDRLIAAFTTALGAPPLLVANAPDAAGWAPGLRVVPDLRPGQGALGGLHTAVLAAPAPVVVAAWDMPFVTPGLLAALADGLDGWDAFLPASGGPRGLEPLCAAYGPAAGPAITAALDAGDLRAIGFHDRLKVGILSPGQVSGLGDPGRLFFNVNTAGDLAAAEQLWQGHASSR
ncbi:MAG: NTP transferase domain-containing protein [Gemmatimonadales bacterium]|nr:NTP transferase domain-containing protein [Gemmatimonadales bacterium]